MKKMKPIALLTILSLFSTFSYADINFYDSNESKSSEKASHKINKKHKSKSSNNKKNKQQKKSNIETHEENVKINLKGMGFNHINPMEILSTIGFDINSYSIDQNHEYELRLMSTGLFQDVKLKNDSDNNLIVIVSENPIIGQVNVDGAKVIKKNLILNVLEESGVKTGQVYNTSLLNDFKNSLISEYNNIGKKQATVDINLKENEEEGNDSQNINIDIKEGSTTNINKINFEGNNSYSKSKLKDIIYSTESGATSFFTRTNKLDISQITNDAVKIVDFYQDNGYLNGTVKDVLFMPLENKEFREDITFIIDEGNKYYYDDPEFNISPEIKELMTEEKLLKLNKITSGKLYKKSEVLETSQNISYLLSSNGYAFNNVSISMNEYDDKVKFIFNITEGKKAKVGNIIVSGNKKTKEHVIVRELRQKSDDEFDLSKLNRSRERLNLTGHFNDAKIIPTPNGDDIVDLSVEVEERRTGNIEFSVGYTQDYGVTFGGSVSDTNFRGSGNAVSASVSNSSVQKHAEFKISNPFFTDSGISLDSSVYGNIYDPRKYKSDYQNYKTDKYGVNFIFGLPINEYDKVYLGMGLEQLKLNTYGDAPKTYRDFIKEHTNNESGVGKYSGILAKATLGWGRNKTNHAVWPTKGYSLSTRAEITAPGSGLQFYKFNANARYLIPIGDKSTISISGRAGYANSYGKTNNLPFFENYFSGGLGTVRGFETNTLGPKVYDRNNSIVTYGGNKILNASIEFLTPLPFVKDSSNVRLGAFIDAGTVWDGKTYTSEDSDNGETVYRENHKSTAKNEFRASAGVAYTWLSPIGPLKFTYAVPLKKKQEDEIQKFQFQIGTTF